MFTKLKMFALAVSVSLSPLMISPAPAAGIPVIDSSNLGQTIAQLNQMVKDYQTQLEQLTSLKAQLEAQLKQLTAMTGGKGIKDLLNGSGVQNSRVSAPDLNSIVNNVISGSSIGGQSTQISAKIDEIKTKLKLDDLPRFDGSQKPLDRGASELAGAGIAAVGSAADTYLKADKAGERVNDLISGIDNTIDLKASVDYNTRVTAEVAGLLVEMLRIQSANANVNGMAHTQQAHSYMRSRKFSQIGEQDITGN